MTTIEYDSARLLQSVQLARIPLQTRPTTEEVWTVLPEELIDQRAAFKQRIAELPLIPEKQLNGMVVNQCEGPP